MNLRQPDLFISLIALSTWATEAKLRKPTPLVVLSGSWPRLGKGWEQHYWASSWLLGAVH